MPRLNFLTLQLYLSIVKYSITINGLVHHGRMECEVKQKNRLSNSIETDERVHDESTLPDPHCFAKVYI